MMIDMILATDMGLHFDFMGKLDKLRKKYEKEGGSGQWDEKVVSDYRTLLCALLIKCADISNVVGGRPIDNMMGVSLTYGRPENMSAPQRGPLS
jgi:hypothetical protein